MVSQPALCYRLEAIYGVPFTVGASNLGLTLGSFLLWLLGALCLWVLCTWVPCTQIRTVLVALRAVLG